MRTIEKQLYTFDELNDKAKAKALEKLYDINTTFDWQDCVYDEFKCDASNAGFNVNQIYYSGFWSQGDGAMFEYDTEDKLRIEFIKSLNLSPMREKWLTDLTYANCSGKHSGHYYHSKCVSHSITFEADGAHWLQYPNINKWIESYYEHFYEFIVDKYENLCDNLYTSLEKEYDYLTSEEQIIETIKANDYEFYEDGTMY